MTRDRTFDPTAFLRKTGLLAAVLLIIGGIFGMHVVSPVHSAHDQATTHQQAASYHDAAVHQDPAEHLHAPAPDVATLSVLSQCSCSGSCTSMEATPASCILSMNTTSLAAPFPGSSWVGVDTSARPAKSAVHRNFYPSSPSPGDLSISRT
ncbi:hypothetical protein [Arthrobacter sp.]|uniref:hypothetical protein n=1 Tax=Arthrobacter sp. TaxID=1667 RepID=UPI0028112C3A|nr:hypothetical protein [Arthrobacter sp.]